MENHYVTVENREKITISQVIDVDAFDEENLWADVSDGSIELTGEKLNIQKLDLKEGILIVTGRICSFNYTDKKTKEKRNFFGRLRKRS